MNKILICDLRIENYSYSHNIRDNERFTDYFMSLGFSPSKLYMKSLNRRSIYSQKLLKFYELLVKLPIKRKFIKNQLRDANILFFPSINFEDFFYLYFLLKSVKNRDELNGVILRLISVDAERFLENGIGKRVIRYAIDKIMGLDMSLHFAVETREAAIYIHSRIGFSFDWLPTPINNSSARSNKSNLTLFLPGKPRLDKGSFQIDSYRKILESQQSAVQILSQKVNSVSSENGKFIELQIGISLTDYKKALEAATWLFAPHILESFRIRGSALLADSLESRIPLLARKGTSLGNFVDEFKIGLTFKDYSDFYSAVSTLEENLFLDYEEAFDSAISEINRAVKTCMEDCLG